MMHGTADYAAVSGRGTEPAARALLSFDCTFLALLAASVSGEDSPEDLLRCPFKPFGKKRAMLGSPSAALDFAADVCVILSEFKLSDDIADGKPAANCRKTPPALRIQKSTFAPAGSLCSGKKAYAGACLR